MTAIGNPVVGAGNIVLSQIAFNSQSASYTLVLSDASKWVGISNASANTLTVPKNSSVAYVVGTQIIIEQQGAGLMTVAPVDGNVTINSRGSALKMGGQYATAVLTLETVSAPATTWNLSGDITP